MNEALFIEYDARPFVRTWGKRPRGCRRWEFKWNGEKFLCPAAITYTEARAWMRVQLAKRGEFGLHVIDVLP